MDIRVPVRTYVGGFFAAVAIVVLWKLGSLLMLLFLSLLIGMTLYSAQQFLEAHRWKRWMALTALITAFLGAVASVVFVLIPKAIHQIGEVLSKSGDLKAKLLQAAPTGFAHNALERAFQGSPDAYAKVSEHLAAYGSRLMNGFYDTSVVLIVAIYMMIDGPRAYRWIIAYFDLGNRAKFDATISDVRPVVSAYILGQAITSALAGVFVYALARILKVPGALTLALLAAILDVLPIIGFIASAASAALLALTVSGSAALTIAAAYLGYHALETYVLIPFIYGNRLKLSTLAVLISLLCAGVVGGIPGMIAVLPLVAAYPVIEKHWLRGYFAPETIALHQEQLTEAEQRPAGLSNPKGLASPLLPH